MAEFYGRIRGNRGEATRCGSKASGIHATVESWTSIVRTSHNIHGPNKRVGIEVTDKGGFRVPLMLNLDADALVENRKDEDVILAVGEIEAAFDKLSKVLDGKAKVAV